MAWSDSPSEPIENDNGFVTDTTDRFEPVRIVMVLAGTFPTTPALAQTAAASPTVCPAGMVRSSSILKLTSPPAVLRTDPAGKVKSVPCSMMVTRILPRATAAGSRWKSKAAYKLAGMASWIARFSDW